MMGFRIRWQGNTARFASGTSTSTAPIRRRPRSRSPKRRPTIPGVQDRPGDVEYDHSDRWQEIGTLPQPDILGATVHELGHSLGLGHSASDAANMYWIFNRTTDLGTAFLDQDDIDGIHAIYGAGIGSVTPLAGSWPDRAILPTSAHSQHTNSPACRAAVGSSRPLGPEITFTANSGTLVSSIAGFPTGFEDPFTVSVGGVVVGQFTADQSVSFQSFPGGGVSEFVISGIDPFEDDPLGFPLKLAFVTPTGSFAISAVPEPAAHMLLILAILALSGSRRDHPRLNSLASLSETRTNVAALPWQQSSEAGASAPNCSRRVHPRLGATRPNHSSDGITSARMMYTRIPGNAADKTRRQHVQRAHRRRVPSQPLGKPAAHAGDHAVISGT